MIVQACSLVSPRGNTSIVYRPRHDNDYWRLWSGPDRDGATSVSENVTTADELREEVAACVRMGWSHRRVKSA